MAGKFGSVSGKKGFAAKGGLAKFKKGKKFGKKGFSTAGLAKGGFKKGGFAKGAIKKGGAFGAKGGVKKMVGGGGIF